MQELKSFRLHFEQDRTEKQIILTNNITRSLTELNLHRINQFKQIAHLSVHKTNKKEDFLYVCFTGLPPLNKQYDNIGIPGQRLIIYPQGFQPGLSQDQIRQRLDFAQLQHQAYTIHQKLSKRTDKHLVFIYHSFGTSLVSVLFRLYYNEYRNRVVGMCAIGCYPIRSGQFNSYLQNVEAFTKAELLSKVDQFYEEHLQFTRKMMILQKNPNKYAHLAMMIAFGKGMGFSQTFDYNRRWPPILKCFIYGRQDNRIAQNLLNQIAAYYCYKRKFDPKYQSKVKQILAKAYKINVNNVQQRFIYNIDGGKHSIHIQKRYQETIKHILNEYLSVIEEMMQN